MGYNGVYGKLVSVKQIYKKEASREKQYIKHVKRRNKRHFRASLFYHDRYKYPSRDGKNAHNTGKYSSDKRSGAHGYRGGNYIPIAF